MYVYLNIETRSCNRCCCSKVIMLLSCVSVALFIQHEKRLRSIIFPCVFRLSVPYFPHNVAKCPIFLSHVTQNVFFNFL